MVFSSSTFLFLFLPIVICIYFLIDKLIPMLKNAFLLIASLLFYGFGEPKFLLILMGSILTNWVIALYIDRARRNSNKTFCLVLDIFLNLGLLLIFKYANFITTNLNQFISNLKVMNIALPIGISFFTFQAMSYVIDVYRKEEKAQVNLINLGLYISFFPQLIAGPIIRYSTIANEICKRKTTWNDFTEGIMYFLRGLFKKIIFANNVAVIADAAFSGKMEVQSILFSWLGALSYALQIYFDFSGYSDMAIGLGRVFGFHFPKNFNYPYAASSVTDFWRRWHISLSSWFRDYVYIPLGGRGGGYCVQARNLFIVWLLTGIWHGANWTFILWGLAYFVALIIEKFIIHPERFKRLWIKGLYGVVTFLIVMLCWVLFRADSIITAGRYLKSMFGLYGNPLIDNKWLWYSREYVVFIILGLFLSTPLIRFFLRKVKVRIKPTIYEIVRGIGYILLFFICVSYIVTGAHNPFIYFNF